MWTKAFWKMAATRAVKTFAQTLVALIGVGAVSILTLDWVTLLSTAATAALLSILTSVSIDGTQESRRNRSQKPSEPI